MLNASQLNSLVLNGSAAAPETGGTATLFAEGEALATFPAASVSTSAFQATGETLTSFVASGGALSEFAALGASACLFPSYAKALAACVIAGDSGAAFPSSADVRDLPPFDPAAKTHYVLTGDPASVVRPRGSA